MDIDFSALMNASPNPYVVMDKDPRLVWMNRAYLAATMRERDELVGQKMFEAFPSEAEGLASRNHAIRGLAVA